MYLQLCSCCVNNKLLLQLSLQFFERPHKRSDASEGSLFRSRWDTESSSSIMHFLPYALSDGNKTKIGNPIFIGLPPNTTNNPTPYYQDAILLQFPYFRNHLLYDPDITILLRGSSGSAGGSGGGGGGISGLMVATIVCLGSVFLFLVILFILLYVIRIPILRIIIMTEEGERIDALRYHAKQVRKSGSLDDKEFVISVSNLMKGGVDLPT